MVFSPVFLSLPWIDITLVEVDASTHNLVTVPIYPWNQSLKYDIGQPIQFKLHLSFFNAKCDLSILLPCRLICKSNYINVFSICVSSGRICLRIQSFNFEKYRHITTCFLKHHLSLIHVLFLRCNCSSPGWQLLVSSRQLPEVRVKTNKC